MSDALSFYSLAGQFLRLAENAAELIVHEGNLHAVVTDDEITPTQYKQMTRWSDHAVGIAILFSFYHGVELVLKGCVSLFGPVPTSHSLTSLLEQLKKAEPNAPLVATLANYVGQINPFSPMGKFLAANNISIDKWYQALKYPRSTTNKSFSHLELKYGASYTVDYWNSLKLDSALVRKQAAQLINQVEPT